MGASCDGGTRGVPQGWKTHKINSGLCPVWQVPLARHKQKYVVLIL